MNGFVAPSGPGSAGWRQDFRALRPDYAGGSIVNLMSSLVLGLGGDATGHEPLALLPPEEVRDYRQVALIVVDGLGDALLTHLAADSYLATSRRGTLTSVFPSTTAAAVTTFLTGLAPQQHGLTGWHMYFRELGAVLAVLPGRPRFGGVPLGQAGIAVDRFFGHRPVFERLPVPSQVLSPALIAHSDFNRGHCRPAAVTGYASMAEFFQGLVDSLSRPQGRRFVYGYWSELDHIAHVSGPFGTEALTHFRQWDACWADALAALARRGDTLLIVSADHGFVEATPARTVRLEEHAELQDCLVLPLCGEPRLAYAYVRPGRVRAFERYLGRYLADVLECQASETLIAQGWFGPGAPHPRLAERVGDYTLVMKENYVILDRLPTERPLALQGVHGGVSALEMTVPLVVASR